jgi:hypothetical protein
MKHLDEKMLEIRNRQKQLDSPDIQGTVNIGGQRVDFADVNFFNGKMAMRLPKKFTDMPLNFAKIKYPAEQRPQIIKMNEDGSINVTLSLYPEKLNKEGVADCIAGLQTVINRMNPANLFFELKTEQNEVLTVGYFDYKSNALDSDLYNIMFVTSIAGNTMLGTFNCRLNDRENWQIIALQMILSIRDLTLVKEGGPQNARSGN